MRAVVVTVVVTAGVAICIVGGVVVRTLRLAYPVAESWHRHAIDAGVAVHPDVASDRLVVSLEDEVGELVAVAENVGHPNGQVRMVSRELCTLGHDAVG
jgi:hypothetical protein